MLIQVECTKLLVTHEDPPLPSGMKSISLSSASVLPIPLHKSCAPMCEWLHEHSKEPL